MAEALPARASLAWLRKTAKQQLHEWRAQGRDAKLADAQLAIARQYGFPSWRELKAHVDQLRRPVSAAASPADEAVARVSPSRRGGRRISSCRRGRPHR